MSEFMQIDIRLEALYGSGGLSGKFPKLSSLLKSCGRERILEDAPTLYHLVDVLLRLAEDPAVPASSKTALVRMENQFRKVRDEAREYLLARRLNDLDRTLYQLEDLYKDLERELQW